MRARGTCLCLPLFSVLKEQDLKMDRCCQRQADSSSRGSPVPQHLSPRWELSWCLFSPNGIKDSIPTRKDHILHMVFPEFHIGQNLLCTTLQRNLNANFLLSSLPLTTNYLGFSSNVAVCVRRTKTPGTLSSGGCPRWIINGWVIHIWCHLLTNLFKSKFLTKLSLESWNHHCVGWIVFLQKILCNRNPATAKCGPVWKGVFINVISWDEAMLYMTVPQTQ
jgi:hypothetical protein